MILVWLDPLTRRLVRFGSLRRRVHSSDAGVAATILMRFISLGRQIRGDNFCNIIIVIEEEVR